MGTGWGWRLDQEDTHAMALGDRIRTLRREAGWSQAELAQHIGVDALAVLNGVIDGLLARTRLTTLTADIS